MDLHCSSVLAEDLDYICSRDFIRWDRLKGASVLITGASGLIGSAVTNALLYASERRGLDLRVIACVRDVARTKKKLAADGDITYIESSVEDLTAAPSEPVDYVIHAANPTSSSFFVRNPAETIETAVTGTRNLLNIAREKAVRGFVFLSTMEVYGHPTRGSRVREPDVGAFDPTVVRNCYPLSKLLCESMVAAYASEYSVPGAVVRLTQTFGPGVEYGDTRIFAELARCVIEKKDFVLHSDGTTERCYLYVADAVTAILTALLGGEDLIKHMNEFVAVKDATVVAYDESGAAFAYKNPDEKTDDLYFKVDVDGKTYDFCVEFYLCGADTDVYKAVEGLKVGDVIDLEGFLYWYNGANLQATNLTVK